MRRLLMGVCIGALGLAACTGADQFGDPDITVELEGEDANIDAQKIADKAQDACDVGIAAAVADPPSAVTMTLKWADGDTGKVKVNCKTGELTELEARG